MGVLTKMAWVFKIKTKLESEKYRRPGEKIHVLYQILLKTAVEYKISNKKGDGCVLGGDFMGVLSSPTLKPFLPYPQSWCALIVETKQPVLS